MFCFCGQLFSSHHSFLIYVDRNRERKSYICKQCWQCSLRKKIATHGDVSVQEANCNAETNALHQSIVVHLLGTHF